MKSVLSLVVVCLGCLLLGAAPPPAVLSVTDLMNRPDRWPESVTLKKDFRFSGGQGAQKGQQVHVLEFKGPQVVVDAGNNLVFRVAVSDCDLVESANKAWATLTPAQRAVDPAMLVEDPSVWPDKVAVTVPLRLDGGKTVRAGEQFDLIAVASDGVQLYSAATGNLVVDLEQTDLIKRARERALIDPDKRSSRIAAALRDVMVDTGGRPFKNDKLDETRIFALYYGASWCGPCRQFSPDLVKFINNVAVQNPKLTIVLMSNDKEDKDMLGYMMEEKMPWPAMPLSALNKSPLLVSYVKGSIPQLAIVDRHGKLLADAYSGSQYAGPKKAMDALSRMLDSGAAR